MGRSIYNILIILNKMYDRKPASGMRWRRHAHDGQRFAGQGQRLQHLERRVGAGGIEYLLRRELRL